MRFHALNGKFISKQKIYAKNKMIVYKNPYIMTEGTESWTLDPWRREPSAKKWVR